jgi:hypothetical protein
VRKISVDWIGLGLMVVMIGALQLVLDQGQTRDWFASPMILIAAFASLVAGVFFFVRGWGLRENIVDFELLRDRSFAGAQVAIMGFGVAMFGSIAILPLFVQGLLGYPVLDAGYLFMPRGLAAGFSMVVTGAVLMRYADPRAAGGHRIDPDRRGQPDAGRCEPQRRVLGPCPARCRLRPRHGAVLRADVDAGVPEHRTRPAG